MKFSAFASIGSLLQHLKHYRYNNNNVFFLQILSYRHEEHKGEVDVATEYELKETGKKQFSYDGVWPCSTGHQA